MEKVIDLMKRFPGKYYLNKLGPQLVVQANANQAKLNEIVEWINSQERDELYGGMDGSNTVRTKC